MHFFYIILSEESFEDFLRILSLQNSYILSLCFGKSAHHRNEVTKLQPHDTNNPDLSKDLSRREMQNSHCLLGLVSMGFPAKWSLFLCHLPSLFPRTVSLTMKPPLQMWSHLVTKKSMWSHLDRLLSKISFFLLAWEFKFLKWFIHRYCSCIVMFLISFYDYDPLMSDF